MSANLDLLRPSTPAAVAPRRSSSSLVVGAVLILGVLAWAFLLLKPTLFPARRVASEAVRVEAGPARATVAVEATGWVEPDPFPILVRPLVDGFVDSLDVVESQQVKAGEPIGRLRSSMIEGALDRTRAMLASREASLPTARAELDEAKGLATQRLDLRREVARLEGELATAVAEIDVADAEATAASARADSERFEWEAQQRLKAAGNASDVLLARAAAALASARGELAAKSASKAKARAVRAAVDAQLALAREALAHPVALDAAVAKATARLAQAEAEVAAARTELEVAEREARWLVVQAPADGVVLRRNAAPGSPVGPSRMGRGAEGGSPDEGEGTLASLYDPAHLQARIDVPVGSVGGLGAGRRVELTVEALAGRTFHGVVTRLVSQADVLKNTLQAKVRIEDPDPLLKPEMLIRARFLAVEAKEGTATRTVRVLVPRRAVRDGAVFVYDPTGGGRARRVPVATVHEEGDVAEVTGDVGETHRVITDVVTDGEHVEVSP